MIGGFLLFSAKTDTRNVEYVFLFTHGDGFYRVLPDFLDRITAGYVRYKEKRKDTVLHVITFEGSEVYIAASEIQDIQVHRRELDSAKGPDF